MRKPSPATIETWAVTALAAAFIGGLAGMTACHPAQAHPVPGLDGTIVYPSGCCRSAATDRDGDCAPIDDQYVTEGPDGYEISLPVGAHPKLLHKGYIGVVPYSTARQPIDGRYHICLSTDGASRYCFFGKPGAV
jgi:hypothetical protein